MSYLDNTIREKHNLKLLNRKKEKIKCLYFIRKMMTNSLEQGKNTHQQKGWTDNSQNNTNKCSRDRGKCSVFY